jgi:hypothetical protein
VELLLVVAIVLIVTAIAIPSVRQVMDNYRLRSSGYAVASVLREAQMAAVKNNQPYYVQSGAAGGCGAASIVCAVPASRFVPPAYNPQVDPTGTIATYVGFQPAAPPNVGQLNGVVGIAPQAPGGPIGFNARGLPCVPGANPFLCQGPAAFEWFMQSSVSQGWEAITVTPAGRIRSWRQNRPGSARWE